MNQVDLVHRTIRLNPGETKNDEGRMAVTSDELYTLISACVAGKQSDDFVFTRNLKWGGERLSATLRLAGG